ncbi:MAG: SpoIVB peptidase S55 domain-containing protein, partial [Gemmatimonadota bacterium]
MRHIWLRLLIRGLLPVAAPLWLAAAAGALPAGSGPALARSSELRPGDTGYGCTVLRGAAVDTFAVEILGVEENALAPGFDLILARLSGAGLENTGVIRGMSGSPVYVGGRLVGAVAYGWGFAKAPICGITPIHAMLDVLERDLAAPAGSGPETDPGTRAAPGGPYRGLEPLGSPVWVAGAGPSTAAELTRLLAPYGLEVTGGPAGSAPAAAPETEMPLAPGAAVGAQLIGGDLSVTAIGTLTWRDGDRVAAFGHPMFGLGRVDVPLTGATIYGVLPSQSASFKLGAATGVRGALRQDRLAGVGGVLGQAPALLPVTVDVGPRHFSFAVLRQRLVTPGLVQVALLAALESEERLFGEATVEIRGTLYLRGGERLETTRVFAGASAILEAAGQLTEPLRLLAAAPFPTLEVERVEARVSLRDALQAAELTGLRLERPRAFPGDSVAVVVRLQPHRQPPQDRVVRLRVPPGLAPGLVQVRAGSGRGAAAWEAARRPDLAA